MTGVYLAIQGTKNQSKAPCLRLMCGECSGVVGVPNIGIYEYTPCFDTIENNNFSKINEVVTRPSGPKKSIIIIITTSLLLKEKLCTGKIHGFHLRSLPTHHHAT
jgi:hypothetical protein